MNSFNHYAYGAIGEWLYGVVAGIQPDPDDPGFHHVTIAPEPGGQLTWARAALDSPYGRIESRWEIKAGQIELQVTLPANTWGTIRLPGTGPENRNSVEAGLSGHRAVREISFNGKQLAVEAGPGTYRFVYPWPAPTGQ
jgi:alpha-L-rhamnosidase